MIATDSKQAQRARSKVTTEILYGRLIRRPCEKCGEGRYVQAHHDDYSKPLDVRWLCPSCHKKHHNELRRAAGTLKIRKGVRLVRGARLFTPAERP